MEFYTLKFKGKDSKEYLLCELMYLDYCDTMEYELEFKTTENIEGNTHVLLVDNKSVFDLVK